MDKPEVMRSGMFISDRSKRSAARCGETGMLSRKRLLVSVFEHPRVFGSTALRAVDDEAPFAERDARQATGHDDSALAAQNVRAEVDTPAFETVVDPTGVLAQLHNGLADEIARVMLDLL